MSLNQLIDSRDVRFTLFEMLEVEKLNRFEAFQDFDRSVYEDTLELAEKIAIQLFYPTNAEGDKAGLKFDPKTGEVKVPESFKKAFNAYIESGFHSLAGWNSATAGAVSTASSRRISIASQSVRSRHWTSCGAQLASATRTQSFFTYAVASTSARSVRTGQSFSQ